MSKKIVILTGANGQLSQYLIKYLQENEPDIQIVGTLRHKSYDNQPYIYDRSKVIFELMDLGDQNSIEKLISKYKPDFFINTAANAYVGEGWDLPYQQIELNTVGVLHQLEAIRKHSPHTRYFNMGTSEEFACSENTGPQNEDTKISPKSPYGCAKAAARYLINVYRRSYNLYAIQGWTFNFESKLRGEKYVTRKITKGVARIYHAIKNNQEFEPLELGNIYSNRSWQHASDVSQGVWYMVNQDIYNSKIVDKIYGSADAYDKYRPEYLSKNIEEFVLSVPDTFTVKFFIEKAFEQAGIYGSWVEDEANPLNTFYLIGANDKSIGEAKSGVLVKINAKYYRPLDVTFLHGDASKARKYLGWTPKISFSEIVKEMVESDIENYDRC